MERIVYRISSSLVETNAVAQEDQEVFAYGLELILSSLTSAGILLLLSLFFTALWETATILSVFAVLQTTGGGFHASTHMRCSLTMLCCWVGCMLALPYLSPMICLALILVSCVSIYYHAPIEHKNAPMSSEKKRQAKQKIRHISTFIALLACVLLFIFPRLGYGLTLAIALSGISMFAAKQLAKHGSE